MTAVEYGQTQNKLSMIALVAASLDLEEFLNDARRADSLGAVINPTLYIAANVRLAQVIEMAEAVLRVKRLALKHMEAQAAEG